MRGQAVQAVQARLTVASAIRDSADRLRAFFSLRAMFIYPAKLQQSADKGMR